MVTMGCRSEKKGKQYTVIMICSDSDDGVEKVFDGK